MPLLKQPPVEKKGPEFSGPFLILNRCKLLFLFVYLIDEIN